MNRTWRSATGPVALAVLTIVSAISAGAAAQIAPRYVVDAGESRTYRDVAGNTACRTDHLSTMCVARSLEKLTCDADRCEAVTASEEEWRELREASEPLYVHPYTEVWSLQYGGFGCTAAENGGFVCQDGDGVRRAIPTSNRPHVERGGWERLLVGSWAENCAVGDAITYFANGTLEGDRRVGRWRVEGDLLTENYVVQADPDDDGATDMRSTRRSRITLNDDGSILKGGEWLSGGDVPADAVITRCGPAAEMSEPS